MAPSDDNGAAPSKLPRPERTPIKIAGDFELHPLLLEDLKRVHEELRANGELRSREALEGFCATCGGDVLATRPWVCKPPRCHPPPLEWWD